AAGAEARPDDAAREHDTPTIQASIVGVLSFTPVQVLLLLVFGIASAVFLVSLVIVSRRDMAAFDFQSDQEGPRVNSDHGWQHDGARSSQMFVDDKRGQEGIDPPPWRALRSPTRRQNGDAISTEPPRSGLEDVKTALEDFKATLIYENRTQRFAPAL